MRKINHQISIYVLIFFCLSSQVSIPVKAGSQGNGSIISTVEINSSTPNGPSLADADRYGNGAASIGDLDGDGVPDIAVGARDDDAGNSASGALHIHFMNRDGSVKSTVEINDDTPNGPALATGIATGDGYGTSVAGIGDLDGDGVQDIAVGAFRDDAGGTDRGAVHIHFMNRDGSIDSTVEINSTTTNGPTTTNSQRYSASVENIGDLNGDGVQDLAVGAYQDDPGGVVHIHFMNRDGSVDSTVEINSTTTNGPASLANNDRYGVSIANMGDLNGDGVQDIAVGALLDDAGGTNRGAVHIHFMNRDGSVDSTVEINSSTTNGPALTDSDQYGAYVTNLGDLNKDGVTDLAVGATFDDTGGTNRGAIYIHFLNTDGSIDSTVEINSNTTNGPTLTDSDEYGQCIVSLEDLNGDGVIDIGVCAVLDDQGGSNRGAMHIHFMGGTWIPDPPTSGNSTTTASLNIYETKIITNSNVPATIIAEKGAFPFDVNLEISQINKTSIHPQKLFGNYWQISNYYQMWFTSFFNGARLAPIFYTGKIPITILSYKDSDLYSPGTNTHFPERSLMVAYSSDKTKWKLLPNIVRNTDRNEVAFISYLNGYFAIVSPN
jgi:hypothetical protein